MRPADIVFGGRGIEGGRSGLDAMRPDRDAGDECSRATQPGKSGWRELNCRTSRSRAIAAGRDLVCAPSGRVIGLRRWSGANACPHRRARLIEHTDCRMKTTTGKTTPSKAAKSHANNSATTIGMDLSDPSSPEAMKGAPHLRCLRAGRPGRGRGERKAEPGASGSQGPGAEAPREPGDHRMRGAQPLGERSLNTSPNPNPRREQM